VIIGLLMENKKNFAKKPGFVVMEGLKMLQMPGFRGTPGLLLEKKDLVC